MDEKDEDSTQEVVRTKRFTLKPMSVDEAILQMNLLGHNFFVFTNAETNQTNVVYQRKDKNYGLIEPEV
jgi:putative sigma-54 modulation protein